MPLIQLIIIIAVIGIVVWLINRYLGSYMTPEFLKLLNIVAIVGVIIWLLNVFGVWKYLKSITVG